MENDCIKLVDFIIKLNQNIVDLELTKNEMYTIIKKIFEGVDENADRQ